LKILHAPSLENEEALKNNQHLYPYLMYVAGSNDAVLQLKNTNLRTENDRGEKRQLCKNLADYS
jgi:hypothetical protein